MKYCILFMIMITEASANIGSLLPQADLSHRELLQSEAPSEYQCEIEADLGYVSINTFEVFGGEKIKFSHYLGKEHFNDPYKIRNLCKLIMKELQRGPLKKRTKWFFYRCESYTSIDRLILIIEAPNKTLSFAPEGPSNNAYRQTPSNDGELSSCDPH